MPIARQIVRFYGLAVATGVLIATIEPDSPAAQGRLHEGDMIIGLDGHEVASIDQLHRLLYRGAHRPGDGVHRAETHREAQR